MREPVSRPVRSQHLDNAVATYHTPQSGQVHARLRMNAAGNRPVQQHRLRSSPETGMVQIGSAHVTADRSVELNTGQCDRVSPPPAPRREGTHRA